MRSTASLANLVMRKYNCAWLELADKEGLIIDSYSRYVDDRRLVMPSINKGWRWENKSFKFRQEFKNEDENGNVSLRIVDSPCSVRRLSCLRGSHRNLLMEKRSKVSLTPSVVLNIYLGLYLNISCSYLKVKFSNTNCLENGC